MKESDYLDYLSTSLTSLGFVRKNPVVFVKPLGNGLSGWLSLLGNHYMIEPLVGIVSAPVSQQARRILRHVFESNTIQLDDVTGPPVVIVSLRQLLLDAGTGHSRAWEHSPRGICRSQLDELSEAIRGVVLTFYEQHKDLDSVVASAMKFSRSGEAQRYLIPIAAALAQKDSLLREYLSEYETSFSSPELRQRYRDFSDAVLSLATSHRKDE